MYDIYRNGMYVNSVNTLADARKNIQWIVSQTIGADGRFVNSKKVINTGVSAFEDYIGEKQKVWLIIYQCDTLQFDMYMIVQKQ